jgi:tetratricopeptide (TPR) repeat protein
VLREALAEAPYPTAVAFIEGMLIAHLTLKATNDHDLAAAREALGIAIGWRKSCALEDGRVSSWYFTNLEIAKKQMLVAELDHSEESLRASVVEARHLLEGCRRAVSLPPLPPQTRKSAFDFESCTSHKSDSGIQVARDQFALAAIRASLKPSADLVVEAEAVLNETIVANPGENGKLYRAIALMRLGYFAVLRGEQVGNVGSVNKAYGYYSRALECLQGTDQPGYRGLITSFLATVLLDRNQPNPALSMVVEAQKDIDRASLPGAWEGLERMRGVALFRVGRDEGDRSMIEQAVGILRSVVTKTSKADEPLAFATMQNYLGDALTELFRTAPTNEIFADAQKAYQTSSEVTWCSRFTKLSGTTLDSLGELTALAANAYRDPGLHVRAMRMFAAAMTIVGKQDATLWPFAANGYGQSLLRIAVNDQPNAKVLIGQASQVLSEVNLRLTEAGDIATLGRMKFNNALIYSDHAASFENKRLRRLFFDRAGAEVRAARTHFEVSGLSGFQQRVDELEEEIADNIGRSGLSRTKPAKILPLAYPSIGVQCSSPAAAPTPVQPTTDAATNHQSPPL